MTPPLKLIVWEDAYNGNHDWTSLDEIADDARVMLVTTVGHEIRRDAERVTLAMSLTDHGSVCDLFTIPVGMIRKERTLK